MTMPNIGSVPWLIAGTIAISSILGWIWVDTRYIDIGELVVMEAKLVSQHTVMLLSLDKIQLATSKRSVRFWLDKSVQEPLTPTEKQMLDEQVASVSFFTQKVLAAGGTP
jgi:hypothetical protein